MQAENAILKHPWHVRAFHLVLSVSFTILAATGILIHYKPFSDGGNHTVMQVHLIAAVLLTIDVIAFLILCADRIILFIKRIFTFSTHDLRWLFMLGGYPQKFLLRKKVPVPPMGKYNTGQKIFGFLVVFGGIVLIATGWALWAFPHAFPRNIIALFGVMHFWITVLLLPFLCVHIFLAVYMFEEFKAMFFTGTVSYQDALEKSPLWVRDELVSIEKNS